MPDDIKINIINNSEAIGRETGKTEKIAPSAEREKGPEATDQDREKVLTEIASNESKNQIGQNGAAISEARNARKQREKKIEKILEKDLEDIYLSLPADIKSEFRKLGEETANQINNLLDKAQIKIKEIIILIRKWLMIIPGVNKFFLEQETKIKADEIVKLKVNSKQ